MCAFADRFHAVALARLVGAWNATQTCGLIHELVRYGENESRTMASIRYIVTNLDSSVEFYRDKLEFSVDMHNPGKFAALIRDDLTLYLSAPGAGSGGTAGGNPEPGGWNRFMIITKDMVSSAD